LSHWHFWQEDEAMSTRNDTPLVLVADDEVHTTHMLELIFEREGYHVEIANDGVMALDYAQRLLPDLILLDIQMPGMNGFDVLQALRENQLTANIPTILITAKAMRPADVAHGLNLGADDYLSKPFAPLELIARAESKMKARRLEYMLQRQNQALEALLRAGEELNQSRAVDDLLSLILFLTLDLLPGSMAYVYLVDERGNLISHRSHPTHGGNVSHPDTEKIISACMKQPMPFLWTEKRSPIRGFPGGMAIALEHNNDQLGGLIVVSDQVTFDTDHMRSFIGVGKQASLALRNAQLYEILAEHAETLEDMVAARTAELESAHQMLIRSEKLASIGHLAASIAHEINNPLQPILIHLEHIIEDAQHQEPIDLRAVESIQESIERITRIVRQLLEFTGKRGGDAGARFIDVKRALETVVNLNRKLFEQSKIDLEQNLEDLPPIYGSKDQLEQVFMNITLNAHAAMKAGDKLTIEARVTGQNITIQFIDTGCGIPANQINNIFDPFYSTKPNGTGLGLFVSYSIIQNHQGTIEVESKVNVGTTFTIRLPIDVPSTIES
jgi:signal transduction histidine kinase/CheY-like chemotaxis protein